MSKEPSSSFIFQQVLEGSWGCRWLSSLPALARWARAIPPHQSDPPPKRRRRSVTRRRSEPQAVCLMGGVTTLLTEVLEPGITPGALTSTSHPGRHLAPRSCENSRGTTRTPTIPRDLASLGKSGPAAATALTQVSTEVSCLGLDFPGHGT